MKYIFNNVVWINECTRDEKLYNRSLHRKESSDPVPVVDSLH